MTRFRDKFLKQFGDEGNSAGTYASVVGCGLDRVETVGKVTIDPDTEARAIEFFNKYQNELAPLNIGARRDTIHKYVESGIVPHFVVSH